MTSQAQPEPKRPVAAALNFSLNVSKLPNAELIALATLPDGAAAGAGSDDGPEHRVIDMPAAVVANGGADIVGNDGAIIREQLLHGFAL